MFDKSNTYFGEAIEHWSPGKHSLSYRKAILRTISESPVIIFVQPVVFHRMFSISWNNPSAEDSTSKKNRGSDYTTLTYPTEDLTCLSEHKSFSRSSFQWGMWRVFAGVSLGGRLNRASTVDKNRIDLAVGVPVELPRSSRYRQGDTIQELFGQATSLENLIFISLSWRRSFRVGLLVRGWCMKSLG